VLKFSEDRLSSFRPFLDPERALEALGLQDQS
jgi:hypothetical protein